MRAKLFLLAVVLVLVSGLVPPATTHAQSNLLSNGSFTAFGGTVPDGWSTWGTFQQSDKESLTTLIRSGPYSWRQRTRPGLPTGGGFQRVTVTPGTQYTFTAHALIWTCDDTENQCRSEEDGTWSDTSSGAMVRVGIDPSGGTDPTSGSIVWGGFSSPFAAWTNLNPTTQFGLLSVSATASADYLTVFTYYTASQSMAFHDVFWDDASLVASGGSGGSSGGSTGGNTQPTVIPTARFVVSDPQTRADGSQVHVVQAGDTLSAISVAYGVPLGTLREYNGMSANQSLITPGQAIIVRPAAVTPTANPARAVSTQPPTPTPPGTSDQADTELLGPVASAGDGVTGDNGTGNGSETTPPDTQAVVDLTGTDDSAEDGSGDDDDSTRQMVQGLALVVLGFVVVGAGGMIAVAGYMVVRRRV
ncbi:MAG: LysM peptidoglycan-binding domain-containing protein [Chloroflexi bacterium]|nr:LysM peptidoglycan-binding domain-containing protein [Chloroflexota bacterium]